MRGSGQVVRHAVHVALVAVRSGGAVAQRDRAAPGQVGDVLFLEHRRTVQGVVGRCDKERGVQPDHARAVAGYVVLAPPCPALRFPWSAPMDQVVIGVVDHGH